jgi:NAD(P)-dependent dehydrogenase (short-subunit alcohol dehydrogenase family)
VSRDVDLEGKVALVTGGGRGIGLAIVRELAGSGARVVLNDAGYAIDGKPEQPGLARNVAEELRQEGVIVTPSATSAATLEGARELAREASAVGPVDILVNNAAILQDRMVFNLDPASWDAVLANNLNAAFYLTQQLSNDMRKRLGGRIINMVSSAGLIGNRGQANYGAAKGGLVSLSRIAALDLARYGVTVNAIAPFAHTRVTETIPPATPWLVDYIATVKGVAPPLSVARLVHYLCSERAKIYTGQVFGIRGNELFLFSQPRPVGAVAAADAAHLDDAFIERTFAGWEEEGLLTSLESDLMVMSRTLSNPKPVRPSTP